MYFVLSAQNNCRIDSSFENPQHTFLLRNKKNIFQLHTLKFIWKPGLSEIFNQPRKGNGLSLSNFS